jgi:hypothetical protein
MPKPEAQKTAASWPTTGTIRTQRGCRATWVGADGSATIIVKALVAPEWLIEIEAVV